MMGYTAQFFQNKHYNFWKVEIFGQNKGWFLRAFFKVQILWKFQQNRFCNFCASLGSIQRQHTVYTCRQKFVLNQFFGFWGTQTGYFHWELNNYHITFSIHGIGEKLKKLQWSINKISCKIGIELLKYHLPLHST